MKKLLAITIFSIFISPLLAIDQARLQRNLSHAWNLSEEMKYSEGLEFSKNLIDNKEISDEEKIHYLVFQSIIYSNIGDIDNYDITIKKIFSVCIENKKASDEFRQYF